MDSTIARRALIRRALRLGGAAAAGLLLAACGGPAAPPTPVPPSGNPAPAAPTPATAGGTAPKPAAAPALTYKGKITVWFPFNPREERTNPFGGREKALTKMSTYGKKWEELHPGVTIDYFEGPNVATSTTEFRQWLVTQANGDTLPHIAPTHRSYRNQFVGSNWFVPLDKFYAEPNPYAPAGAAGSARWLDQWKSVDPLIAESKDERGQQIHWFPSYNGRGIFYNPELLDKAGVKPPTTFEEFMQACEKIKAAGAIAFQARPKAAFGLNQMWNSIANTLEEATYLEMDLNKNGDVETEELARGVKKGIYGSQAKSVQAAWSLAKRTSQYFAPNWNSADTRQLYVTGKLAMTEEGSFYMPILLADKELKFKPAVFDFPNITKETSPLAADVTYQLKEMSGTTVVTKSASRDGNVEACVDLLRFLSQPEICGEVINEIAADIPAVDGAKAVDYLSFFQKPYRRTRALVSGSLGQEVNDLHDRVMELYLLGQRSQEDALKEWQQGLDKATEETIKRNNFDPGKW